MNAYEQLRLKAAKKRAAMIREANAQYAKTLQAIKALRYQLAAADPEHTDGVPVIDVLAGMIPHDRPFILGRRVDFAQLVKNYASSQTETRYSPATIISAEKHPVFGPPDEDKISRSHIERFNLTLRMTLRRFTRLTNAHSKRLKHHEAMQAIFFAFYNFCRKHETLKGRTPAMASGLADKVWTVKELLETAAK